LCETAAGRVRVYSSADWATLVCVLGLGIFPYLSLMARLLF
jgi:hypothetical protein